MCLNAFRTQRQFPKWIWYTREWMEFDWSLNYWRTHSTEKSQIACASTPFQRNGRTKQKLPRHLIASVWIAISTAIVRLLSSRNRRFLQNSMHRCSCTLLHHMVILLQPNQIFMKRSFAYARNYGVFRDNSPPHNAHLYSQSVMHWFM